MDPKEVIKKKYITDGKDIYGFYTGLTLLNQFELTSQVPNVLEIVTNHEATNSRRVKVGSQDIIIKKSRVKINNINYKELMLLELFNIIKLKKPTRITSVSKYMKENKILRKNILDYANDYPAKATKNLILCQETNDDTF